MLPPLLLLLLSLLLLQMIMIFMMIMNMLTMITTTTTTTTTTMVITITIIVIIILKSAVLDLMESIHYASSPLQHALTFRLQSRATQTGFAVQRNSYSIDKDRFHISFIFSSFTDWHH